MIEYFIENKLSCKLTIPNNKFVSEILINDIN